MQQRDEAAHATAKKREQELVAQLTAQADGQLVAARAQWEAEAERKARATVEPVKELLVRTEKERDEAKQSASGAVRQVQDLEKKLTEVSSYLNGWKNEKTLVAAGR